MKHLRLGSLVLSAIAAGCGGAVQNPAAPSPPAAALADVTVSGWLSPLQVGQSAQLTAVAVLADGSSLVVTTEAAWESSNTAVAIVSPVGLVVAQSAGVAEIRAIYQARAGRLSLSVAGPDRGLPSGLACGVERWPVKTLSDAGATGVKLNQVEETTIKALNGFASHCSGLPETRTFSEEFRVYDVVGRVRYAKQEDDRDYHIALADPSDQAYTIVAELADIACEGAVRSPYRDVLALTRNAFVSSLGGRAPSGLVGSVVRVQGVGFYDFDHGQNGRARNCLELHPIVSFRTE